MTFHNRHVRFPGCYAVPDSIELRNLAFKIKIETVQRLVPRGQDDRIIPIEFHGLVGIDIEAFDQCPQNLKEPR